MLSEFLYSLIRGRFRDNKERLVFFKFCLIFEIPVLISGKQMELSV